MFFFAVFTFNTILYYNITSCRHIKFIRIGRKASKFDAAKVFTSELQNSVIAKQKRLDDVKKAEEVRLLKEIFGNEIRVLMGIDFGSGTTSLTVVSLMIHWKVVFKSCFYKWENKHDVILK